MIKDYFASVKLPVVKNKTNLVDVLIPTIFYDSDCDLLVITNVPTVINKRKISKYPLSNLFAVQISMA